MKVFAIITLVVLAMTSAVRAQQGAEAPLAQTSTGIQPIEAPAVPPQEPLVAPVLPPREASRRRVVETKSPLVAGLLSGGVTLAGIGALSIPSVMGEPSHGAKVVIFTGLAAAVIGPSLAGSTA